MSKNIFLITLFFFLCIFNVSKGAILFSKIFFIAQPDTIENFDDGQVMLQSYPVEDMNPTMWSLDQTITYSTPYSLKLYGNTWKMESISPRQLDTNDVWQISVYIQSAAEIQGFGISDSLHTLFYSFAGQEEVTLNNWLTVYQGAFSNSTWNNIKLPVGNDWLAEFGYLPVIKNIVFVNDRDNISTGVVYFDGVLNITASLPRSPKVEIKYTTGKIYSNDKGIKSIDVQFQSTVNDSDSYSHQYLWNFGDDSTSTLANPSHTFLVEDDHSYTVFLDVKDETNLHGIASCKILVDPGASSFPITINFVGDFMLARRIETFINTNGIPALLNPTLPIFGNAADISVINLECTLSNSGTPHPTKPILLRGSPQNINCLSFAGVDVANFANNHIMDYGLNAFRQTESLLDSKKIIHFGVGANSVEALSPVFLVKSGVNIAFIGSSDRTGQYNNYQPYLNAGYNKPGFGDLTKMTIKQQIQSVRNIADLVIFNMHSGNEYSTFPTFFSELKNDISSDEDYSPYFKLPLESDIAIRHYAIDNGADVVICHHPHIIHPFEVYKGKLIAHSLGNFVFDLDYPETFPSVILNGKINSTGFYNYFVTPVYIDNYVTLPAKGELGLYILDDLANGSRKLNTLLRIDRRNVSAEIILDTSKIDHKKFDFITNVSLTQKNGNWISQPIPITRQGSISEITSISPSANWNYRLGKQVVWFGNFENEGCSLWEMDSQDEWFDTVNVLRGKRTLCQKRTQGQSAINTNFENRLIVYADNVNYTLHCNMRTINSNNAGIQIQFFNSRTATTAIATYNLGIEIDSTTQNMFYSNDIVSPTGSQFFNLRLKSEAPLSGTAYSFFDDVGLIEWSNWQSLDLSRLITYPNDYYWIQIQTGTPVSSAQVSYTCTDFTDRIISKNDDNNLLPSQFVLYQNYPNPFNSSTTIKYDLPYSSQVELKIFNILGEEIRTLINSFEIAGSKKINWNGKNDLGNNVSSGVYFYTFRTNRILQTKKMIIIK